MPTYLLDTNIASYVIKGDIPRVRKRIVQVPIFSVAVSAVTQAELLYGVAKRGHPPGLSARVREFLARVAVLPWDREAGEAYAELRAACEAEGKPLGAMDMLIAAHAKSLTLAAERVRERVILVTSDQSFAKVPSGLHIEDWTQ